MPRLQPSISSDAEAQDAGLEAATQMNGTKTGAPAWDPEPRKARLNASVVFTPARGSSILASLSEASGHERQKAQASPFPLACNSVEPVAETRPRGE